LTTSIAIARPRAECAIPLPGGTLVLAPPAAFGSVAAATAFRAHAGERLRPLLRDPRAVATLRSAWRRLGLPGAPERLSERHMIDLLNAAVASHRLTVAYFPHAIDPDIRVASGFKPAAAPGPAAPGPTVAAAKAKAVRDMSHAERVEAALRLVPKYLSGPLKEAFLQLISPTSIGLTVAAFAGLAAAQFFGYGEAADVVLAGIAYGIAGLAGVRALYQMAAAAADATTAKNDADLDTAAKDLADAFVVLGLAFLTIFITRAARRTSDYGGTGSARSTGETTSRTGGGGGRSRAGGGAPSARAVGPGQTVENLDPKEVRFSQNSAGGNNRADALRRSMAENGWNGPPIDAVRIPDGVVSLDNTRVAVAREQGIPSIPVRIWEPGDPLPQAMLDSARFGPSQTWGEALAYRTSRQIPPLGPTGTLTPPSLPGPK